MVALNGTSRVEAQRPGNHTTTLELARHGIQNLPTCKHVSKVVTVVAVCRYISVYSYKSDPLLI
jgi:hypothetical protein